METDRAHNLRHRAFRFTCDVARVALPVAHQPGVRCIADQLVKSAASVGANLEEAKAASSRREFIRFVEIALREAREARYWIRICAALNLGPDPELSRLETEAGELAAILGSIVV